MSRAAMVKTFSALILLSHVAAMSASTWTAATVCADDPEIDLCDLPVACADDPEVDLCDDLEPTPAPQPTINACGDDPEVDLCDGLEPAPEPEPTPAPQPTINACGDDPEVDLCDGLEPAPEPEPTPAPQPTINACGDDPEVDLCDGLEPAPEPEPTPAPQPTINACGDDPEVDLCDGLEPAPEPEPTPAPQPTINACGDDPEVDLCDGLAPTPNACGDDPEVDLCDGPAPTPELQPDPTPAPTLQPTTAPRPDLTPAPTVRPTPAPTFAAGTTVVIKQSMSFSSSGTSTQVAAAVLEHLATYMDVPKSACTVNVAEVTARRLTEKVPVVAFLVPVGRRLSSSTQWQADYEIQLDDAQKADEVMGTAEAISGDSSTFAGGMASKFAELGLMMDANSIAVQSPTKAAIAAEPSIAATTPPASSVFAEGDTEASTDALVIILILAFVAVIGVVCAGFWLRHFRRSGYQRKHDDHNYSEQGPAADPEAPMDFATRVANLGGLWSYKGGSFTLEPVAGAEKQFKYNEIRRDGATITGILSQQNPESPWVQGPLDMNGGLFGFIRVQLRGANTATTNYKKQEMDEWGADVIANQKDEFRRDIDNNGSSGEQQADSNEGVVM